MQFVRPLAILAGVAAFAFLGCKTEVNNPSPPQQTVIHDQAPPQPTEVIHEHDATATPPTVENNVKVDR